MDKRTTFYLDCLKYQIGLSDKTFPHSNMVNPQKTMKSKAFEQAINNGEAYIAKGKYPNTWIAYYEHFVDEETVEDIELVFEREPSQDDVKHVQFLLSIEEYLMATQTKPFVKIKGDVVHWTLLPAQTPEKKWEMYIALRNEKENKKVIRLR